MTADDKELPRSSSINEPPGSDVYGKAAAVDAVKPSITALEPASCVLGDPDFDLHVSGEGLSAGSMIVFAGHDEPTTLNADGTVSTGINMAVWLGPDTVKVAVRNGPLKSNELDFVFEPAGGTRSADRHPHDERGHLRHDNNKRKR